MSFFDVKILSWRYKDTKNTLPALGCECEYLEVLWQPGRWLGREVALHGQHHHLCLVGFYINHEYTENCQFQVTSFMRWNQKSSIDCILTISQVHWIKVACQLCILKHLVTECIRGKLMVMSWSRGLQKIGLKGMFQCIVSHLVSSTSSFVIVLEREAVSPSCSLWQAEVWNLKMRNEHTYD